MPTYTFKDNQKDIQFTKFFRNNKDKETYLHENVNLSQILTPIITVDPLIHNWHKNRSGEFKDILQKVKKAHPLGNTDTGNLSAV